MKLPRSEDIAILFVTELAGNTSRRPISLASVASAHGVSVLFLKKLARMLLRHGMITSKEGVGGGYVLAREAKSITVWDVISAVQPAVIAPDMRTMDCPINAGCIPQKIRRTIDGTLKESLSRIAIADFL